VCEVGDIYAIGELSVFLLGDSLMISGGGGAAADGANIIAMVRNHLDRQREEQVGARELAAVKQVAILR